MSGWMEALGFAPPSPPRYEGVVLARSSLVSPVGLVGFIGLVLVACRSHSDGAPAPQPAPSESAPSAASAAPSAAATSNDGGAHAGVSIIDHDDFTVWLPGRWTEKKTDDGYDLRSGPDQIVVAVFPPMEGVDAIGSMDKLSAIQRNVLTEKCKKGLQVGTPDAVKTSALETRQVRLACAEPALTATMTAGTALGRVISFEHYRYATSTTTPESERMEAKILETLRIKPAGPAACPAATLSEAETNKGACVEPGAIGAEVAAECGRQLLSRNFKRDDTFAALVATKTGKKVICYGRPDKKP